MIALCGCASAHSGAPVHSGLAHPPVEPPAVRALDDLAPGFRTKLTVALLRLGTMGWHPVVIESLRTNERQAWLYGMGRTWDDGRGIVTQAPDASHGWHLYGLAVDVAALGHEDGSAPAQFYRDLGTCAMAAGLTWGGDWNRNGEADEHHPDRPHVQWYCDGMLVTPSDHARELRASGGNTAVWQALHAA